MRPRLASSRLARWAAPLLVAVLGTAKGAVAQTPTPTPTPTATPTPAPVFASAASTALFSVPNGGRYDSANVVLAPDGSVWTTSALENVIIQLSADGTKATRWPMPTDAAPSYLLKEPDGTFWVAELGGFKVGKFDPSSGVLTEWLDEARRPTALVKRPDGKFWMPETGGLLALFDPATGTFTYYKTTGTTSLSYPFVDADGSVWSSDFILGSLVRFSPDGTTMRRWPLPDALSSPSKIFRAFDGNIWISLYASGQLARFDPISGEIDIFQLSFGSLPFDLQTYKSQILYSEQRNGFIGFFDPSAAIPIIIQVLTPEDVTSTTIVKVHEPTMTTLTPTTVDMVVPAAGPIVGTISMGLTELPAGNGSVYGLAVDEARGRIFYGTGAGEIGVLGPSVSNGTADQNFPSVASLTSAASGVRWTTQVVAWNRGTPDSTGAKATITFDERLLPSRLIAGYSPGTVPSVPPGALLSQPDPLTDVMRGAGSFGGLRLSGLVNPTDLFAWARVAYARADGGTYGFARNGLTPDKAIGANQVGFVFCPPDAALQRTNAGLLLLTASVGTVSIVDADGVVRASVAYDWPGGYHAQASTIFQTLGVPPLPNARVVFSVTTGTILPFGTSIDAVTNDPVDLASYGPNDAATLQWLPGVARGGPMGSSAVTDLQLYNGGTKDASVTLVCLAAPQTAGPPATGSTATVVVPAGKVVFLPDVLGTNLALPNAVGTLVLVSDNPVFAFARVTAAAAGGGRFGYGVSSLQSQEAIYPGSSGVFLAATDNGFDATRSDLLLLNPTDTPTGLTVTLNNADGTAAGSLDQTLAPKESRLLPAVWFSIAGYGTDLGRLTVTPATGGAAVFATLLRQDQKTGDTDALLPNVIPK